MVPTLVQPFMETDNFLKIEPSTADPKSIIRAQIHRELMDYQLRKRMDWYSVLTKTVKGFLIQGQSYMKVIWKDKKDLDGEPVSRPEIVSIPASHIRYDWTVPLAGS